MAPRIFKNARILIVDDEAANVDLLRRLLERAGFSRIESTNDSRDAAELYVKFRPDLILLDLHMPVMDGDEFAIRYRQQPGPHAQIVLLTSAADGSEVADRLQARSLVTKPVDFTELSATLDRYA